MTHAQQVMKTEGFLHLDANVLLKVVEADQTRIEEIDLFKALVRWYQHWEKPDEEQAERLFRSIRYGQMTGQQLVTEVRHHTGERVPQDLYIQALEQVAAPGVASFDEVHRKQSIRRQPPIGSIQTSDPSFLVENSTKVRKVGPTGWNCTAVIEPSTTRTCFVVEHLTDAQNGVGIAIFDPERNAMRCGSGGFPNPNQWGADCLIGIYGTGCFFGMPPTDSILRWHTGLMVEVTINVVPGGVLQINFAAEGVDGDRISVEGVLSVSTSVKLAVALYSPDDEVSVESVW